MRKLLEVGYNRTRPFAVTIDRSQLLGDIFSCDDLFVLVKRVQVTHVVDSNLFVEIDVLIRVLFNEREVADDLALKVLFIQQLVVELSFARNSEVELFLEVD